jgi:pilin isopeptide linkage protein
MNPKKILKRAASMGMALLLLVSVTAPAQAAYSTPSWATQGSEKSVTLNLTATLKVETDDTLPSNAKFTFQLFPDEGTYPMPEGDGDTVVMTGPGEIEFGGINFTKPGEYSYIIDQVEGNNTNYTYDKRMYSVEVTVYQMESVLYMVSRSYEITEEEAAAIDLTEAIAAAAEDDTDVTITVPEPASKTAKEKTSDMIFNDSYTEPYVPPYTPPTATPSPSPETSPEPSEEPSPEPSEEPSPEPSEEPSPEPSEEPSPEVSPETSPETSPGPIHGPGDGTDNDNKDKNGPGYKDDNSSNEEDPSPSDKIAAENGPQTSGGPGSSSSSGTPGSSSGSSVTPGTTPKTGDETDNSLWITMICVAAAGLVAGMCYLLVPRKRRHR